MSLPVESADLVTVGLLGQGLGLTHVRERFQLRDELAGRIEFTAFDSAANGALTQKMPSTILVGRMNPAVEERVPQILAAGGTVVCCEPQSLPTSSRWREWQALASRNQGRLTLIPWREWSENYQQLRHLQQARTLGSLLCVRNSAKLISLSSAAESSVDAHLVEVLQLLEMLPGPIVRVSIEPVSGETLAGWMCQCRFANGAVAELTKWNRCFVPEQSGWVAEGNAGGFSRGRYYHLEADGELVDEPVVVPSQGSTPGDPLVEWLMAYFGQKAEAIHSAGTVERGMRLVELIADAVSGGEGFSTVVEI